jgi:hypothetical protein
MAIHFGETRLILQNPYLSSDSIQRRKNVLEKLSEIGAAPTSQDVYCNLGITGFTITVLDRFNQQLERALKYQGGINIGDTYIMQRPMKKGDTLMLTVQEVVEEGPLN